MAFELEKIKFDLGDTAVENIFINDFMPQARGTFVKVYLLGYKFACSGEEYSNKAISRQLSILESDVLKAWDYWENQGIIEKINKSEDTEYYDVKFLNLKQLYISNSLFNGEGTVIEQEKEVSEYDEFLSKISNPKVANLFTKIDYYMRREVPYSQKRDVASWMETYNMPPELIEEAFLYATEVKKVRKMKYIEAIVRNWADSNVRTKEALEQNYFEYDEKFYRYSKVKRALGLTSKEFTENDFSMVNSWFEDFNYDLEMILRACERGSNVKNPSFAYINGVIKSWKEKGIKTVEDIDKLDIKEKSLVESKKANRVRTTKFHNFDQRSNKYTAEELEEIARKKRDEYIRSRK